MSLKKTAFFFYQNLSRLLSKTPANNSNLIGSLHNLTLKILKPEQISVENQIMYLDPKDSLRLSIQKSHDPVQTSLVKKLIKNGDIVLDIGAHIGYYTLIFASLTGPKGKVFAFEPAPDNFEILNRNVLVNNYKNVVLINKAASDISKGTFLYISKTSQADHKTYDDNKNRNSINVNSLNLDNYFKNIQKRIDFVKIDAQGFEYKILEGMKTIIKTNKKLKILTEFCPEGITKTGKDPKQFLKILSDSGYKLFDINEYTGKIRKVSSSQLLEKYNLTVTNILCLR